MTKHFFSALLLVVLTIFLAAGCASNVKTDAPAAEKPQVTAVTFQFEHEGQNVLTWWRKIDSNGEKGPRFSAQISKWALTMGGSSFGRYKAHTIKLEPGVYYLDSFQIQVRGGNYFSQTGHFTTRNGWDDAAGEPLYLAFNVAEGQTLVLPKVSFVVSGTNKEPVVTYNFDDPENIFIIGKRVKR